MYDEWFEPIGLPAHWRRIGTWRIPDQGVAQDRRVVFYAIEPGIDAALADEMRTFPLPSGVDVEIGP